MFCAKCTLFWKAEKRQTEKFICHGHELWFQVTNREAPSPERLSLQFGDPSQCCHGFRPLYVLLLSFRGETNPSVSSSKIHFPVGSKLSWIPTHISWKPLWTGTQKCPQLCPRLTPSVCPRRFYKVCSGAIVSETASFSAMGTPRHQKEAMDWKQEENSH